MFTILVRENWDSRRSRSNNVTNGVEYHLMITRLDSFMVVLFGRYLLTVACMHCLFKH